MNGKRNDFDIVANARESKIKQAWELSKDAFPVGSIVSLRLAAEDAIGNVTESRTIRLHVRPQTIQDENSVWGRTQERLARELSAVEQLAHRARNAVTQAESALKTPPTDRNATDKMRLAKAHDLLKQTDDEQNRFRELLKRSIEQAPNRSDEEELLAIGRILSEAQRRHTEPAMSDLQQAARVEQPSPKQHQATRQHTKRDGRQNRIRGSHAPCACGR